MKGLFSFLFISFFFAASAQVNDEISVVSMGYGNQAERSFWVRGDKAFQFVDYLFQVYPDVKRKGCKHRFRHVEIQGIAGVLSLRVQEGVHGRQKDGNCISSYFNSFDNEKYKAQRMSKMTEDEEPGIIIYVKKRGRSHSTTRAERATFVRFIRNHCCF